MRKKRKICLGVLLFILLGSLAWGVHLKFWTTKASFTHLKVAPRFSLKDPAGKLHRLEDFKGNFVVLHFWASWCAPCLLELPRWVQFSKQWGSKPIRWIAISLDSSWGEALKILPEKDLSLNLLSLIDPDAHTPEQYGTYKYPETFLIDSHQKIVTRWIGEQDWNSVKFKNIFTQLTKQ